MTLPDPKFAPRRSDLPWLRRRRAPAPVAAAATAPAKAAPAPTARATPTTAPAKATPPTAAPARATPPATAGPPHAGGGKIDYTRRDRSRPAATSSPTPTSSPPSGPSPSGPSTSDHGLDLSRPTSPPPRPASPPPATAPPRRSDPAPTGGGGGLLDLSGPTSPPPPSSPPPRPAPAAASGGDLLDLSGPSAAPSPPAAPGTSTSLDLGGGTPPAPAPGPQPSSTSLDLGGGSGAPPAGGHPRRPSPPPPTPERHHVVRRTRAGATTLLEFDTPVVTLDRLQSGVGALTIDAVVGDEVGDLRIGAAWALTDGRSGTVELEAGRRTGPPQQPVVWAQKEGRFERIAIDLRRTRSLARLLVYGFSASRQTLRWGGTLVVTTYGGDRIDAPIVSAPSPAVIGLLSLYNVDGEFVIRAEMDPISGTVRDTCRAFGYDRITWLDDHTPIT